MAKQSTPIQKPRLSSRGDNKWFCAYGMHLFESKDEPVDCPDRHILYTTLLNDMDISTAFKRWFFETYPNKRLGDLKPSELLIVMQKGLEYDTATDDQ